LCIRNSSTLKVMGIGKVILKMTFRNFLTLNNVKQKWLPDSLLSKNDYKMIFKSDKLVLIKSKMFVGKGYACNDLSKMNVMNIVTNNCINNKNNSSFSYLLESCDMWHERLGHVNYSFIQKLINLELLWTTIFKKNPYVWNLQIIKIYKNLFLNN